ncbi:MAG TPA: HAD family hydrolase [Polyangiaceae bacterium]|nr:HAD family hydrolase [Polyangiaceae bacterium]
MLRTLSLDAGGVLVRPNWRTAAAVLAGHGVAVTAAALAAEELAVMRELDTAESIRRTSDEDRTAVFLARVLARTGVAAPPDAARAAIAELCRIHAAENLWDDLPEDVVPALARFRALELKLVVLSNANGTVRSKLDRLGLTRWFAAVVDSGEEGVEKPDPRFFALALARVDADPATTLHVGDLFHVDVVGARAAGLRAVLVDRGGLQGDRDCPRVRHLGELADALERGLV